MTRLLSRKLNSIPRLTCLVMLVVLPVLANADGLTEQRDNFLKAQKYLTENNEAGFLAASANLTDYPLYPFLRYQWLKGWLANTEEIIGFLTKYKATRYVPLLREKWLDYLADNARWGEFFVNYEKSEKTPDDCRFYWAQYQIGKQIEALTEAKRLWTEGKESKSYCQQLFNVLQKSSLLTADVNWQRFELALTHKHTDAAKAVLPLLTGKDRSDAELWLSVQHNPKAVEEVKYWQEKSERIGRMYAHAIKQLLTLDVEKALKFWETNKVKFTIDNATQQEVERRFGIALLGEKDPRAYEHLAKVTSPQEEETRFAKVRAALVEQNWLHVTAALAGLSEAEKQQPQWQYWRARALVQTGQEKQADEVYKTLAKDRSFYGFLAADTLKLPYQFSDHPLAIEDNSLKALAEEPAFKACQEFIAVNLPIEARRQWYFAIKSLPKDKLMVAAKLAQQWQWHQLAITTLVKADYWDDLALRFPLLYDALVKTNAEKQLLDAALIYGLMRQESMLDKEAISGVGARGLMQLMPDTAKTVAHTLQEIWLSSDELFSPEVNIRYGSHYFRSLLDRLSGHTAVAAAAYNAGPNRAQKWLPLTGTMPADIWIDTIPYKETRKYVTSVLSYAIIYQKRLQTNKFKLIDLLPAVRPAVNMS